MNLPVDPNLWIHARRAYLKGICEDADHYYLQEGTTMPNYGEMAEWMNSYFYPRQIPRYSAQELYNQIYSDREYYG
jgi:hypothetical protein